MTEVRIHAEHIQKQFDVIRRRLDDLEARIGLLHEDDSEETHVWVRMVVWNEDQRRIAHGKRVAKLAEKLLIQVRSKGELDGKDIRELIEQASEL